jgi:PAS domain S-box-containing protein
MKYHFGSAHSLAIVIGILVATALLLVPLASQQGPAVPGLVALFGGAILVSELATASLIFAGFRSERKWSLLLLAMAYLFSTLMAMAHLATFPGAILSHEPIFPAPPQSTAWIFIAWITVFAALCLTAVTAEVKISRTSVLSERSQATAIWGAIVGAGLLACSSVVVALAFADRLPFVLSADASWTGANVVATSLAVLTNVASVTAIYTSTTKARDPVFNWLAIALTALACANMLAAVGGGRYTVGWISGRVFWLVSASVLLVYFLELHVRQQRELVRTKAKLGAQLSASDARLGAIVSSTSEAILTKDLDGRIMSWNPAAERLLGFNESEIIGRAIRDLIPPSRLDEEDHILSQIALGERIKSYDTERLDKLGRAIEVSLTVSPLSVDGRLVGASSIMHEITSRKQRERHNTLLLREVNHRSKNVLAVVQAVARQSANGSSDAFLSSFTERIASLAAIQDLLVASQWRGVGLRPLLQAQLSPFVLLDGSRILLEGPSILLSPHAAQTLGMAFHELATNTVRYGALSSKIGHIVIAWKLVRNESAERLLLSWTERDGPSVQPPNRRSFGVTLITDIPKAALNAEVSLLYEESGVRWSINAPTDSLLFNSNEIDDALLVELETRNKGEALV